MPARIIDGNVISQKIELRLEQEIIDFKRNGFQPQLTVFLVGKDPSSQIYVRRKQKMCERLGIKSVLHTIDSTDTETLISFIQNCNSDPETNGILVQLPLPRSIDIFSVFDSIDPIKDVDVFTPENVGRLVQNRSRFLPCTPHGIHVMLKHYGLTVEGKHVVVINRSDIVGKPLSSMLIQDNGEYANAAVTVCHDKTPRTVLKSICADADVIVVAVGIAGFLTPDVVKPHHIVIDVGINRVGEKVVGDMAPECSDLISYYTPVPGGVGPMTVAMLMENTLKAAKLQHGELGGS